MKTIILNRPKSIEKYYDETKYKIFINGVMVTKLKRGEPVELKVDDDVIDIQAKVAYWGSRIERIELTDKVTEIDIARNPRFPYNFHILNQVSRSEKPMKISMHHIPITPYRGS